MKQIYISGKITGIEKEAFSLFEKAEFDLTSRGFKVVNPMKLPHEHDQSWNSYMKECLISMLECDGIFMLTNYEHSRGAVLELEIARKLDFIVTYQTNL